MATDFGGENSNEKKIEAIRGLFEGVRLSKFGVLIHLKGDRLHHRVKAIAAFDMHCHRAYPGGCTSPRFKPLPHRFAYSHPRFSRLELEVVKTKMGEDLFALAYHRIYDRRPFSYMEDAGMGDRLFLGRQFLVALDCAARHWHFLRKPSIACESMAWRTERF